MGEEEEYEVRQSTAVWHLTPAGYVKADGARPADAVKTIEVERHAAPRLGFIDKVRDVWEKKGSKRVIRELIKKYGIGRNL